MIKQYPDLIVKERVIIYFLLFVARLNSD